MNLQERPRLPVKLESLRTTPIARDGSPTIQLVVGESVSSGADTLVQVARIDRITGTFVPLMQGVISVDPEHDGFDFIYGVDKEGVVVFQKGETGGWVKLEPPFRESEKQEQFS